MEIISSCFVVSGPHEQASDQWLRSSSLCIFRSRCHSYRDAWCRPLPVPPWNDRGCTYSHCGTCHTWR